MRAIIPLSVFLKICVVAYRLKHVVEGPMQWTTVYRSPLFEKILDVGFHFTVFLRLLFSSGRLVESL